MKEVSIDTVNKILYMPPTCGMLFVDAVISDTSMKAGRGTTSCREVLTMHMVKSVLGIKYLTAKMKKNFSKFRVVFFCTNLDEKKMEKSLAIIHSVEDSYGIARTEVSRAKILKYKLPATKNTGAVEDKVIPNTYLFEADPFWMRSSVLVSLYLLINRFSIKNFDIMKKSKVTDIESLRKYVDDNPRLYDFDFVNDTIKYWDVILTNANVLFPPAKSIKDSYKPKNIYKSGYKPSSVEFWSSMVGCFGISKLISEKVSDDYKNFKAHSIFHKELTT